MPRCESSCHPKAMVQGKVGIRSNRCRSHLSSRIIWLINRTKHLIACQEQIPILAEDSQGNHISSHRWLPVLEISNMVD